MKELASDPPAEGARRSTKKKQENGVKEKNRARATRTWKIMRKKRGREL